jgi:hypothetical protein
LAKASALVEALGQDDVQMEPDSELDALGLSLAGIIGEMEAAHAEKESLQEEGREQEAQAKEDQYNALGQKYNDVFDQILNSHIQRRRFKYKARDASGAVTEGVIDAGRQADAARILSERGLEALTLDAVIEEQTLFEFADSRVQYYKKQAPQMNIKEEDVNDASSTLESLINVFARNAYKNPGMKNSLTAYILALLKWTIMPANKYYQFMKYIKNPQ